MNKTLAIACLAILFASATAQQCFQNSDCDQVKGQCCSSFLGNTSIPYTQFNCAQHVNGTATVKTQTCLKNGTDYTSICASEAKTCINNATKFASCGSSAAMFIIDLVNTKATCTSGAMSLATSAFFAVLAALALLF